MNVLTIGSFDYLHAGHENLLKKCYLLRGMYGTITIGVNSDEFVRSYKNAPKFSTAQRLARVREEIGAWTQAEALVHDGDTPEFILSTGANLIVVGSDWGRADYLSQLRISWDWLDDHHISLCYVPRTLGVSSSAFREADLGPYFNGSQRDD